VIIALSIVTMPRILVGLIFLGAVANATVPTVEVAAGVYMPMIAFGSYRGSLTNCSVQEGIQQWLQLGGRHIDTAHDYGTEPDVGAAIKASGVERKEIFLTTKIPGPIGRGAVKDMVMNETLQKLGVDYIDLVLIHFPCVNMSDFPNKCGEQHQQERLDTWRGLSELRAMGKVRAIGVSNYNAEQVAEVVAEFKEAPAVNQVQWHLAYHNETLRLAMRKLGTTIEAWASLAGPTSAGVPAISLGDARLKALAQRYNRSSAQVELRWETQNGIVPVTASCSKDHVVGDLESFSFALSDEDIKYLDALAPASEEFIV